MEFETISNRGITMDTSGISGMRFFLERKCERELASSKSLLLVLVVLAGYLASVRTPKTLFSLPLFQGMPELSLLSLGTGIKLEQPATDYGALVFRDGFKGSLYLFRLKDEKLERLIDSTEGEDISVSPSGRKIAFGSGSNLYIARVGDTQFQKVIQGVGEMISLSWSPDERQVAYVAIASVESRERNLCVSNLETMENWCISSDQSPLKKHSNVSWSPDSHHILFRACEKQPNLEVDELGASADSAHFDLYRMDASGGNQINLTSGIGNIMDFYLSPNGQTVLLTSDLENQLATEKEGDYMHDFKAFLMDLKTWQTVEVMSVLMGRQEVWLRWNASPWSPDNQWVLLPQRILQPDTLRAVRPDGTLHHEIISTAYGPRGDVGMDGFTTKLSPHGKVIAGRGRFRKDANECLCTVDANGNHFRELVPDIHVDWIVWSPDSSSIFFKYSPEASSTAYRYGVINADGSGFYDPFVQLSDFGKLAYIQNVHWVRLSSSTLTPTATPLPTATATPAAPEPTATPLSGNGDCTTTSVVIVVFVLALWLTRRSR